MKTQKIGSLSYVNNKKEYSVDILASKEVVDYILALKRKSEYVRCLLGNHDAMFIDYLNGKDIGQFIKNICYAGDHDRPCQTHHGLNDWSLRGVDVPHSDAPCVILTYTLSVVKQMLFDLPGKLEYT